jgi:hypothetical protein
MGMAKTNIEVLISEVYSRRSVRREGGINFRLKDVTNKLREAAAAACCVTSGIFKWLACCIQKIDH